MRYIFIGLIMLIAGSAVDTASAEVLYPWCELSGDGGTNCGFSTLQQCRWASSGNGGNCIQNLRYQGPANASAPYETAPPSRRPNGRY